MGHSIPVRGCLSVANSVGDSYPTGCQNIVAPDVQPHTGLCETIGNLLVLQICKP